MSYPGDIVLLSGEVLRTIGHTLNRPIHLAHAPAIGGEGLIRRDKSKWEQFDQRWVANNGTTILTIDDVFTSEGLAAFQYYIETETMWHHVKTSGYICAYMDNGFASPLVVT